MLFMLYRIGRFLALRMPLKLSYSIAALIGSAYALLSRADKKAVKENLKAVFPSYDEKVLNKMARQIFINFGKYLIDFFRFGIIDKDYIDKYVKLDGFQNLTKALKENKGVIALTAHFGNWELGGVVLSGLGVKLAVVALDHKDSQVNNFFITQRRVTGTEVIPSIGAPLRRCFSALSKNYVLALVGDRDYFNNGIEVDFFGKPTMVPRGPAVFNKRCGSPIVPTFVIRNDDDTFTFKFCEPIKSNPGKDEHKNLVEITERSIRVIEQIIREHPTQWHVFRRFWERIGWERKAL